jgi:alpha-glucosidase
MPDKTWWKHGIVYQIYPRSFQDTDGDGIGDLQGIRARLGYLSELGVDAIWISPIYPSPMADFGYDVADYCDVDPMFGSLADFDDLVRDAHACGLKIILDFVPNHTSDRHPWFVESRADRSNPKRDWYVWRDGRGDAPPNNWVSQFGGPAWTFDPATGQYYLHSFLREQPDLNWRNAQVRDAMYGVLRFWLERGVDGFRVDVIWLLIKDAALRDNPPNPVFQPTQAEINRFLHVYNADQPEIHDVVAEMRAVLDRYAERVLIGEIYLPLERLVAYYGKDLGGAHLPFNFQLILTAWNAREIARLIEDYERALPAGGWPNWVLGNHDQPRIAARVGAAQARVAAMLLLSLRGTPTMYYGDELGLERVTIPPEAMRDPWERNEPGLGLSRDPSRTPFQWDASPQAGFTRGQPWLPLAPDWPVRNADALDRDPTSILTLYRRLIAVRRRHGALTIGAFRLIAVADQVLVYERSFGRERVLVALNFGAEPRSIDVPLAAAVLVSTHLDRTGAISDLTLRADEGVIVLCDAAEEDDATGNRGAQPP